MSVVLSGEGADELFGGYHNHREAVEAGASHVPPHYIGGEHVFVGDEVDALALGGTAGVGDIVGPLHERARVELLDVVAGMQLVDLHTWLPGDILVKADRMTMAHGLELRVPFLDRRVAAVAARLPIDAKIAAGTTKHLLRQAVAPLLPAAVADRPKLGFPVPIGHWLRGELYGFAETLFREAEVDRHLKREVALDLLRRYRRGEDFDWRKLWVLVSFCLWHQVHVERRYDPIALGWQAQPHQGMESPNPGYCAFGPQPRIVAQQSTKQGEIMSRDQVVDAYLRGDLSRRLFVRRLVAVGVSLTAALTYAQMVPSSRERGEARRNRTRPGVPARPAPGRPPHGVLRRLVRPPRAARRRGAPPTA